MPLGFQHSSLKGTNYSLIFFAVLCLTLFFGCTSTPKRQKILIAYSQCAMDNSWREQMVAEMEREIQLYDDIEFEIKITDAQSVVSQQVKDIRNLLKQKPDILIVSPVERHDPLTYLLDSIAALDLPIILLDRFIRTDSTLFFITTKNDKIGLMEAKEVEHILPAGGRILVFSGIKYSSPEALRYMALRDYFEGNLDYKFRRIKSDWTEQRAYEQMKDELKKGTRYDMIVVHNEFMAQGIVKALNEAHIPLPPIVGIGGLNGEVNCIDMVLDSTMTSSITYPTGGDVAIKMAYRILTEDFAPYNIELKSILINNDNAEAIKLQRQEIEEQYQKVDLQNQKLSEKEAKIRKQRRRITNSIFITLILALGFAIYVYRNKKKQLILSEVQEEEEEPYYIPVVDDAKDDEVLFIKKFEQLVLNNIAQPDMNIQALANEFGLSHSTLYRKIKKTTGLSGSELIKLIRLHKASQHLKEQSLTVEEVAFKTGFSSLSYFSTSFAKHFGVSPRAFRK